MSCLNPDAGKGKNFDQSFDVENMQARSESTSATDKSSSRKRWCPLLLALIALACSLVALALGIYATTVARRLDEGPGDEGMYLTQNPRGAPRGSKAVNLFRGTGYFAAQKPMLYPRSDHKSLPIGNSVYLLGGLTNALEVEASEGNTRAAEDAATSAPIPLVLNATVVYDTYSETSRQLADMPQPRFRFCGAVLKGQLYVVGGMAAFEPADATKHVVSDRVMRYTPNTNKWEVLPGRLNHPRADCCAAAVADKLVVAGGWTTDYADTLGSVEMFDPASSEGNWSFMPNLTIPRGDCEAVALDARRMMVIGGVATDSSFTSSVETIDVTAAQPKWSLRANMTKARGDFAAEALPGGRVIVMGGEASNGTATEFALYNVEEYHDRSDAWVVKAPLPEARFRFDTAHVGDRVYAFGGQPTCSSKKDDAKSECVKVALNTVWGYFDVQYPDLYAVVQQDA